MQTIDFPLNVFIISDVKANVYTKSNNDPDFIQYNNVPMGATHYKDRIFLTVPRRSPGIASTLNVISSKSPIGSSPSFQPFPSAETNELHVNIKGRVHRRDTGLCALYTVQSSHLGRI